jgi:hypothetical protein
MRAFVPTAGRFPGLEPALSSVHWYTWSPEARAMLHRLGAAVAHLENTKLQMFEEAGLRYGIYHQSRAALPDRELAAGIEALGEALMQYVLPEEGIVLMRDLLDDTINGAVIHHLFSLLADCPGDKIIYAPIVPSNGFGGAFPLHSDLFRVGALFSVFDRVPEDPTGASTFLPTVQLLAILTGLDCVPPHVTERIASLLRDRTGDDHFDELFELLHDRRHPWTAKIDEILGKKRSLAKLRRGEGYLVDDRKWMHGRTGQRAQVTCDRMHRLAFWTAQTASD